MRHRALTIAVVGIDYPNADKSKSNRRFELLQCDPGEVVHLVPEPKNPHDEHAIGVWSIRGIQVGYLPSERAVLVGGIMRRSVEVRAIFQALEEKVAWCRVAFDGEEPTLPPQREGDAEQVFDRPSVNRDGAADDFYPDDPGGEWGA